MVARRWMWGLAAAAAVLWLARPARAETEAEYQQGPFAPERASQAAPGASPSAAGPARPAPKASAAKAAPRRQPAYAYAAESARTATRLPPEERLARDFLRTVALNARFEVEAARLAAQRAQSAEVLAFADELLQYHGATGPELLHLLAARGMAPPMMDNAQRRQLNRLSKLSGPRFDREFMDRVGRERQRDDVLQFEKAVTGIADPVLLAWIDRQLPSLREQHSSASRLKLASGARPAPAALSPRPVAAGRAPDGGRTPTR